MAAAVVEFITGSLAADPFRLSKPLEGKFAGTRTARRGVYRVIFRIDTDAHVLRITRIAHRKTVDR